MQGDVETLALLFLGDAQPQRLVDDDQNHVADREAVDHGGEDTLELREELVADGGVHAGELLAKEHAGEQRADYSSDAVHAESSHRETVGKGILKRGARKTQH